MENVLIPGLINHRAICPFHLEMLATASPVLLNTQTIGVCELLVFRMGNNGIPSFVGIRGLRYQELDFLVAL